METPRKSAASWIDTSRRAGPRVFAVDEVGVGIAESISAIGWVILGIVGILRPEVGVHLEGLTGLSAWSGMGRGDLLTDETVLNQDRHSGPKGRDFLEPTFGRLEEFPQRERRLALRGDPCEQAARGLDVRVRAHFRVRRLGVGDQVVANLNGPVERPALNRDIPGILFVRVLGHMEEPGDARDRPDQFPGPVRHSGKVAFWAELGLKPAFKVPKSLSGLPA